MVEFETFLESILPVLRILGILFMFVLSFIVGFTHLGGSVLHGSPKG